MNITSINTVNLYRIQGSNSKISRKRIVYMPNKEELKILSRENNIYLSSNNKHHYYFTMKQISKLMRNIAKENGDNYCCTFKNNILTSPQRNHYIEALVAAKMQSVKLEIPLFLFNYLSKFASYNLTTGNTLKIPEFCDTNKLGGAISSVAEWNHLIELLTLNISIKDLERKEIIDLLKTIPNYHQYIFGYNSFSIDYQEHKNSRIYNDNTKEEIKELLNTIYKKSECRELRSNAKRDINNFIQNYKKLVKRP